MLSLFQMSSGSPNVLVSAAPVRLLLINLMLLLPEQDTLILLEVLPLLRLLNSTNLVLLMKNQEVTQKNKQPANNVMAMVDLELLLVEIVSVFV